MVAHRTYPADAGGDHRHFIEHTAFRELFKASELVYMHIATLDLALVVEMDRDPGMALDARYWVYCQCLPHVISPILALPRLDIDNR